MLLIEFIRIDNLKHTFSIGNNLEKGWSKKTVEKSGKNEFHRGRVKNVEKKLKKANVQNSQIGIPLIKSYLNAR